MHKMSKLTIDKGLGIYNGGLIGLCLMGHAGGSDGMIINNSISVFYIDGHWSLKKRTGKKTISIRTLNKIAREALGLSKFNIPRQEDNIYHITEIKE